MLVRTRSLLVIIGDVSSIPKVPADAAQQVRLKVDAVTCSRYITQIPIEALVFPASTECGVPLFLGPQHYVRHRVQLGNVRQTQHIMKNSVSAPLLLQSMPGRRRHDPWLGSRDEEYMQQAVQRVPPHLGPPKKRRRGFRQTVIQPRKIELLLMERLVWQQNGQVCDGPGI